MATIKFVSGADRTFVTALERAKTDPELREQIERMPSDEARTARFTHHEGSDDTPQLYEVQLPPDAEIPSHAHEVDEIIVVTEGELRFGKQTYGVGSSVFIPKMTLYSFQAGPEGVTILNFRPTMTNGVIFKDEFMARRG